jgi:hypothetical protein
MSLDPPMPPGFVGLRDSEVTPAMRAWAVHLEESTRALPDQGYGHIFLEQFGGQLIAARVEHHTWTTGPNGTIIYGNYHGVTLYHAPASAAIAPQPKKDSSHVIQYMFLATVLFSAAFATIGAIMRAKRGRQAQEDDY